jgi:hypothetical protein
MTLNVDPYITKIKKLDAERDAEYKKLAPFTLQLLDLENQAATAREAIQLEMREGEALTDAATKRLLGEIGDKDLEQLQNQHAKFETAARKAERQLEAIARAVATIEQRRDQQQEVVLALDKEIEVAKFELTNAVFVDRAGAYQRARAELLDLYQSASAAAQLVRVTSEKFVNRIQKTITLPDAFDQTYKQVEFEVDKSGIENRRVALFDELNKAGAGLVAQFSPEPTPIEILERARADAPRVQTLQERFEDLSTIR